MKTDTPLSLFRIFALAMTLLVASAMLARAGEPLIQGTWRLSGETPKNNSGRSMSWFLEWTFSEGTFLLSGYPPVAQKGKYRILKSEPSKVTLELYEQKGNFGTQDKQIEIVADEKGGKLTIDGKEGFDRYKRK